MAIYTTLNNTAVQTIAKQYGIGNVQHFKILNGGSENTNYLLTAESGAYVLTVCERKTLKTAQELAQLLAHLANHQFQTSVVVRNEKEESVTIWQDKPIMLKKYLHGKVIQDLPAHLLTKIGQELGKLHQIEAPDYLPKKVSYGLEHFAEVARYAPDSPFQNWLNEVKKAVEKHVQNLPKALIHSDIFYSNVIISEDGQQATIMDFEEACYYYRVFDIGMVIVGLCGENERINLEKARCLLDGYQTENKLHPAELIALKTFTRYAAAATAFWRHRHYHFIEPDEAMHGHYLAMKRTADFVDGLEEDCFFKL